MKDEGERPSWLAPIRNKSCLDLAIWNILWILVVASVSFLQETISWIRLCFHKLHDIFWCFFFLKLCATAGLACLACTTHTRSFSPILSSAVDFFRNTLMFYTWWSKHVDSDRVVPRKNPQCRLFAPTRLPCFPSHQSTLCFAEARPNQSDDHKYCRPPSLNWDCLITNGQAMGPLGLAQTR